jgi:hypothetical protein
MRLQLPATSAGGSLRLAAPTPAIRQLIKVTGQEDHLPVITGPGQTITATGDKGAGASPALRILLTLPRLAALKLS